MKPRRPLASSLAKRFWSVRSRFSWPVNLRLLPRRRKLLLVVEKALVVVKDVVEALAVAVDAVEDALDEVVVGVVALYDRHLSNLTVVANSQEKQAAGDTAPTNIPGQAAPLAETTNGATTEKAVDATTDAKPRAPRQPRQRGPPEDGIPSKNKVMVANLPYDLSEDKVCFKYNPKLHKIANAI